MNTVTLGRLAKARFWLNESSGATAAAVNVFEGTVATSAAGLIDARSLTVEVLQPKGAMAAYGLLGARIEPHTPGTVVVVNCDESGGRTFVGALAEQTDEVRVGLPKEHGLVVFETAKAVATQVGPCRLTFHEAAYGIVGSGPDVFRNLTEILVDLLSQPGLTHARVEAELAGRFA